MEAEWLYVALWSDRSTSSKRSPEYLDRAPSGEKPEYCFGIVEFVMGQENEEKNEVPAKNLQEQVFKRFQDPCEKLGMNRCSAWGTGGGTTLRTCARQHGEMWVIFGSCRKPR